MAYATVAELREYLKDLPASDATDTLLGKILERATAMVNGELGFGFADWEDYAAATERDVYSGAGGKWLYLPAHQEGSVESVASLSGRAGTSETETAVTDYVAETRWRLYRDAGWTARTWYRVAAVWGYGAAPADIVEVTLEVAINIWRGRDAAAFSAVVGAEGGGAVAYNRALTWAQKSIIASVREQYPREAIA